MMFVTHVCRGEMDPRSIEGQLSGKSTATDAGPFSPLSLSSTPPSGPLLVSFSPADISVTALSEADRLRVLVRRQGRPGLAPGPFCLAEGLLSTFKEALLVLFSSSVASADLIWDLNRL